MSNQSFKTKLKQALVSDLPGWKAQIKLAPIERAELIKSQKIDTEPKPSAVMLILFREADELNILFILRSVYDGPHSGQISFPGGRREELDSSLSYTAMRETFEEVGIKINPNDIVGKLSRLYIPNSNFIVEPYVAFLENISEPILDALEVQMVYKILIKDLLKENIIQSKEVFTRNKKPLIAPCFYINNLIIWGATAMILYELIEVIKSNDLTE